MSPMVRPIILVYGIVMLGIASAPLTNALVQKVALLNAHVLQTRRNHMRIPATSLLPRAGMLPAIRMSELGPKRPSPAWKGRSAQHSAWLAGTVSSSSVEESIAEDPAQTEDAMICFCEDDLRLMMMMAEDERQAGNVTGSELFMSIGERMQTILTGGDGGDGGDERDTSQNWWPFLNKKLTSRGRSVWCMNGDPGPKSARACDSFETGAYVTWKCKVEKLSGTLCVGLTSLAVDLDVEWTQENLFGEAFFITQNGNLYNGAQLILESGEKIVRDDIIEFSLEDRMIYVAINGMQLPAALGPVASSLRATVQLSSLNDCVTLVEQIENEAPQVGSRRKPPGEDFDDEASTIGSLFSGEEAGYTPYSSVSSTYSDFSELSQDEPLNIFELEAAAAKTNQQLGWEMLMSDSGEVYYSHQERDVTTWNRPEDFHGESEEAFRAREMALQAHSLHEIENAERAGYLDKLIEDTSGIFDNNAMATQDSHMTVPKDKSGRPIDVSTYVYVDEGNCIGCTNCAMIARNTFYMDNEHGRARAFRQGGDSDDVINEAISSCPVDCIWYVSWDDLLILEEERKYVRINNQARLVSGSNIESSGYFGKGGWGVYANDDRPLGASQASNGGSRCNNCPGKGCYECPLYPVGEHPTYLARLEKKAARKAKAKARQATNCIEAMDAGAGGMILNEDFGSLFSEEYDSSFSIDFTDSS